MPQHTQPSLIQVLLLWTTILSIIQVVFIIFFFTAGPFQSSSAVTSERTMQFQANNTPSQLSHENELLLGKGKMLTYEATTYDNHKTKWLAKNADTRLMSEEGEVLTIKKDGYYFLNLQVTLCSCERKHMVSLKWNSKPLLQGLIQTKPCSTGLLGKAAELSAGGRLEVTINPTPACINTTESDTHLDIIYMVKP